MLRLRFKQMLRFTQEKILLTHITYISIVCIISVALIFCLNKSPPAPPPPAPPPPPPRESKCVEHPSWNGPLHCCQDDLCGAVNERPFACTEDTDFFADNDCVKSLPSQKYIERQGDLSSNDIQAGGYDLPRQNLKEACQQLCDQDENCFAFMINEEQGKCWKKGFRTYNGSGKFSTFFKTV